MGRKISKKTITDAVMELNPTELAQIVNEYNKKHKSSIETEAILNDEMQRKLEEALGPILCIHCGGKKFVMAKSKNQDCNDSNVKVAARNSPY